MDDSPNTSDVASRRRRAQLELIEREAMHGRSEGVFSCDLAIFTDRFRVFCARSSGRQVVTSVRRLRNGTHGFKTFPSRSNGPLGWVTADHLVFEETVMFSGI